MTLPRSVRLGFERNSVEAPVDQLHYTIPLPVGIKGSVKYLQIRSSIQSIGLVEPIIITPDHGHSGYFKVLDGRMRLEALRELNVQRAWCLLSNDDEGYTYNKRVNRLSVIQEHRMIVRAAERGVAVSQLAEVLNLSMDSIKEKFRLLDGICNEAATLLADKPATAGMFRELRKMKPFRQIDVVQHMIGLGDYSIRIAKAMLHSTPPEQLVDSTASRLTGSAAEIFQRMERELAAIQANTRVLEEEYGPANLTLEILKTYIEATLLGNVAVVRWLAQHYPEYLQQLQRIADIKELSAS